MPIPALDLTENHEFVLHNLTGENLDEEEFPLTPRTRFLLWRALSELVDAIRMMVVNCEHDEVLTKDFPPFVQDMPIIWWNELFLSGRRLEEAARTGGDLEPRTPGEEALLTAACYHWIADSVIDREDRFGPELVAAYESLPVIKRDEDFRWQGMAGELSQDSDILDVWEVEAPKGTTIMGDIPELGDYSPDNWHTPWRNMEITILIERFRAAEAGLKVAVPEIHDLGNSWATIGDMLGISKQAAWERYGKGKGEA